MRSVPVALFIVLSLFSLACAIRQPYVIQAPFIEEQWQQGRQSGTASITGQAFLKTVGGSIKTCAGEKVVLLPYNPYTAELYEVARRGQAGQPTNLDPRIRDYARFEICNAQGDFSFEGLPAGRWLISTKVVWEIPQRYGSSIQGGDVAAIVETVGGRATKCFLTGENRTF